MITIESIGSTIFLFGRNKDKTTYVKKINDYKPYFYFLSPDGEYTSINGEKVSKKICNTPSQIKTERDKHQKTFESDIRFTNKFIIDRFKKIEEEPIRKCYIDIEVLKTINGYESIRIANNPINAICCYDSFNKEYKQFCIRKTHNTEKEMLKDFISYIQNTDPDMLIAWNGDGFDFPMLINRITKIGLDSNSLARQTKEFKGQCHYRENKYKILQMGGRILFDLMYAYKKISLGGRESFSLDYISRYEGLGGKEKHKGDLDKLYNDDIEKFIKYNHRDVELLVQIDDKLRLVEFFDELRRMCFCRFIDVFMNSKIADCICLKYAKNHNFVLPKVIENPKSTYEGGFVHSSEPKLHKNIAVMDMKSLYPSVMIGFNMSYETIIPQKQDNCINLNNKYFFKKDKGLIPSIVKPLLDKRRLVKIDMKDLDKKSREYKSLWMKQYALKVIANSFYGVLGYKNFRLYNKDIASAITYGARMITKEVIKWFEEKGFKVIYGDTDSIFIEMKEKSIEDMMKLNNEINNYFKSYFLNFGINEEDNIFSLKFEKVFKTIFFKKKSDGTGAKKKYAGKIIWEDGEKIDKFSITGFESRRSDSPQIGRDFIKNILKFICDEKLKEEIDKYIKEFKNKIKTEFTPEQIGLPIGISKSITSYKNLPIHVRAAKIANEKHNAQIQKGDKIKYLYVKDVDNVIAFKSDGWMWEGYEIDYDMMVRRIIDMKVGPLYNSLDWNYPYLEIKRKKKGKEIKFEDTLTQEELW